MSKARLAKKLLETALENQPKPIKVDLLLGKKVMDERPGVLKMLDDMETREAARSGGSPWFMPTEYWRTQDRPWGVMLSNEGGIPIGYRAGMLDRGKIPFDAYYGELAEGGIVPSMSPQSVVPKFPDPAVGGLIGQRALIMPHWRRASLAPNEIAPIDALNAGTREVAQLYDVPYITTGPHEPLVESLIRLYHKQNRTPDWLNMEQASHRRWWEERTGHGLPDNPDDIVGYFE